MKVNLHDTFDSRIWVEEWLKTIEKHPNIHTDKGSMIGWFSNAIMAGYDYANKQKEETVYIPSPACCTTHTLHTLEEAESPWFMKCKICGTKFALISEKALKEANLDVQERPIIKN